MTVYPASAGLVDLLCLRAAEQPEQRVYTFLRDDRAEEMFFTYKELDRRARAIGALLQSLAAVGDRALLISPPGLDFVAAFYGCLYAGVVAVPAPPPSSGRNLSRLEGIVASSGATIVLGTNPILSLIERRMTLNSNLRNLRLVSTDDLADDMGHAWRNPQVTADSLAYLQYTSGSTGMPKGVMVSHSNLMHQSAVVAAAWRFVPGSVHVLCMPAFHDMGLVGGVIQALYSGTSLIILPPLSVFLDPMLWLRTVSTRRAAISGHINFGFELCIRKIAPADRAALDLSSWQVAYCGGDVVHQETIDRFVSAFGPCGFRREAFCPAYGLAETTLMVTSHQCSNATVSGSKPCAKTALEQHQVEEQIAGGELTQTVVDCGQILGDQKVVIVDPEALEPCPPNRVGEIWVSGSSVAQGYWNNVRATEESFRANLAGEGPFLRTGDLGFLQDGHLFVTGRLKDLIIIRGRKLYPHDIERTVEKSHPALRIGGGAAFSVEIDTEERLVILQELERHHDENVNKLVESIQQAVSEEYEVNPYSIALLREGCIPKTSSGKIARRLCRAAFLRGNLEGVVHEWRDSRISMVDELLRIWAQVLGIERPGIYDSYLELGGSSLSAFQIISRVRDAFNVELSVSELFEASTVANFAKHIEKVRQVKQSLSLVSVGRARELPLSSSQQRIWFLEQLNPSTPAYNITVTIHFNIRLDLAAFDESIREVVRRHESLRTSFATSGGQPVQIVASAVPISLSVVDLRALPSAERERAVRQLATQEARWHFDLTAGPLLRTVLLQLGEQEYVLVLTMHHIISDGWSVGIFVRDLMRLYRAFSMGNSSPLPRLPIQYADFAVWQRQWLQGQWLQEQLSYWKQQLAGSSTLELPTDRPRPLIRTSRGAALDFTLSPSLSDSLKKLSQQEGVTLFIVLLAAFQALLHRYTGQDDLAIGTPVANRNRTEIERLIGCFVNTLVLRTDLSGNPTFRKLLARLRSVAFEAFTHQDVPFETLVEELRPERDLSRNPLFQVMFVMQDAQDAVLKMIQLPGVDLDLFRAHSGTAKFDLTLVMLDTGASLAGSLEYSTDLFQSATIAHMIEHFEVLLTGIVTNPDRRLSDLPILTENEQRQLLDVWNDTAAAYTRDNCTHQLFERQAADTPDAIAIALGVEQLTFGELNRRANQLAHYLRRLGVGPEVLVGVYVERSVEMVIGLLGILKAGGAYVPLDPGHPRERLTFMLDEIQAPVLLTQQRLVELLPARGTKVVSLDADWNTIALESRGNLESGVAPENLAYVIYTSGSTGRPKGCMIPHRGLTNYLTWCRRAYPLMEGEGSLVHSSISFDLTITGLYAPLLVGRRVQLLPQGSEPELLGAALHADANYSLVKITPAHLELLAQQLTPQEAAGRTRAFVIGGENLLAKNISFWQDLAPNTLLFNEYGPTETVVGCCVHQVKPDEPREGSVPIGRPIINTQLYVLDRHLQPVPIGLPGELYIGGDGLARGYLNRPELTAQVFVPHPFSRQGARLYKTGDWVRYLPNGNLEFMGRYDQQVKIHGFRIELEEIEAVLKQHPAVDQTVVLAREDEFKNKRLVAYLVPKNKQEIPVGELRRFLEEKLPKYMVPSVYVLLDALRLSPSGKIDRKALPEPDEHWSGPGHAYVPPRTPVEGSLARLWAQVLNVKQVGIHDNFFELGGDSILCFRVVARAREIGLRLTLPQMFQHQTIEALAAVVERGHAVECDQGPVVGSVPLTPIQYWFFEQHLPDPHHYNQMMMLEMEQTVQPARLYRALQHLLLHHDALRMRFSKSESEWQQLVMPPDGIVPFTCLDLSTMPVAVQQAEMMTATAELQASLSLAEGPLARVAFFDLGTRQPNRLLLVIHHLVVDGISWRILLEDLKTVYRQIERNEAVILPTKTTSFKEWAERLADYVQSGSLPEELAYWSSVVSRRAPRLPADGPACQNGNSAASAQTVSVVLSAQETLALLHQVPLAYRTQINDVLLTALVQAFAKWTGVPVLLIDLEGHGREAIFEMLDLSRTVGWFTTIFPVLLNLGCITDVAEAVKAVKEQLRSIPNRGIGYGLLRYLSKDRKSVEQLQTVPQAEVCLNYLGQFDQELFGRAVFGQDRSPRGMRRYLIEINGFIAQGQLHVDWTYSKHLHRRSTIERLSQDFLIALQSLIAHCVSLEGHSCSPSDFPLANLDSDAFRRLARQLGEADREAERSTEQ